MKLQDIQARLVEQDSALPPVEDWHPDYCGELDLEIHHDGSWHYQGSPIGRQSLVTLFARVLVREGEKYYLVTPVEKVGIQVADAPFLVTGWQQQDDYLLFSTNINEQYLVSDEHPVQLLTDKVSGDLLPYLLVRRNLYARLHQNVFYQLAELGMPGEINNTRHLLLSSGNYQFSLGLL
ncbi:DUF1285 domain-containing protein [Bowmanella sp. Y26]|uniref:DUF1285 domain-containing protein n=1 Tax=Bowmanella yangjiangensis TaxID=2811230 RepID=UPI001BDCD4A1|nr:DUF1285 domain-containing protein [Bowmanella yangjiangensis]MBT1063923.1 DUF1285 domain-containing protein [Bowmanella yangjiangensis]